LRASQDGGAQPHHRLSHERSPARWCFFGPFGRTVAVLVGRLFHGETGLDRIDGCLRTGRNMELQEDPADVVLDCLLGQLQLRADLFVGQTACDEAQNGGFAGGQIADRGTGIGIVATFERAPSAIANYLVFGLILARSHRCIKAIRAQSQSNAACRI
jgi:hypothetical protein